ncbi:hypothetical protein [Rubricoccus marinus]|uniref:Lipoprotein n=1 Tax=Rubricoccus marinus TaxID=716817 RepID=A0A259U1G9_9BACT|nr:hypothetical protein [Rubricoccus marinus]OZC03821.1 hypothetical protein BSZ36_12985 [Rubricoccus marinus]
MLYASTRSLALALAFALTLTACDASIDDATADLTETEQTEAAYLVADALAEDTGGLLASASDLTASVSPNGLSEGPRSVRGNRRAVACRGGDQSVSYDAGTGTHTVTYACSQSNPVGERSYAATLLYQFRDASGGFVARPDANWESVASVGFDGEREGSVSMSRGEFSAASTFEQSSDWSLTGLGDAASPAVFSVEQQRSGTSTRTGPRGDGSREFDITLTGTGIELVPAADGTGYAASGELSYTLTMEVVRGDRTVEREVEGTITLDGTERGLLRILGLRGAYRISLGDGATSRT